jgi:sulfotransferase family protein
VGPNPYLFIVGCPRSGTTLLRRIVGAHPDIAMLPETHWIPRLARTGHGIEPDGLVTHELADWLIGYHRFPRLELDPDEVRALVGPGVTYPEFVRALFELYGRKRGKLLVAEKTPNYVAEIPTLHALFPKARIVHIIRDGRDVCLSALNWTANAGRLVERFRTWSEDPLVTAALWWKSFVSLGREDGSCLGPGLYHEVRYDALVRRPERECRRLCAFLDVAYDKRMLHFHKGKAKSDPSLSAKAAWLPVTPGLRDWRTHLPAEDLEVLEAAAGDLLDELGYERAVRMPGEAARARVARIASLCAQDLPRRRPVPVEVL